MKRVTKKWRKEQVRALLDRHTLYQKFDEDALERLMELTQVDGIVAAWKQPNPEYPSDHRHLYVQFDDEAEDEAESWSWLKAIDKPNPATRLKKTLRDAVAPDLKDFMAAMDDPVCENCGGVEVLTVDHVDPPFDDIATAFMEQHPGIETEHASNGVGNVIKDAAIEAAWIAFHASLSVYQILCRSCNASKGKRV